MGIVFYYLVGWIRKSNNIGAETSIIHLSTNGLEDYVYGAGGRSENEMEIPRWAMDEEEREEVLKKEKEQLQEILNNGGWYCAKRKKLNQGFLYNCSCGTSKRDSMEYTEEKIRKMGMEVRK
ncbi:MAG: hypothetical protein IKO03_05085 [Lachnospiraceae bacterium]|nr:hypothetical protein [Lachnospiraceae bacterium]MBR3508129.1 hypothetical protein [Lachnospiraceae bacterium]MBR4606465.1 hypothetical protein [Lachnospiraceae bacterium]